MKAILVFIISLLVIPAIGQRINPHLNHGNHVEIVPLDKLSNDINYDVNFYHLDLEIDLEQPFIQGNVHYIFTSEIDGLEEIVLDFHHVFEIDSISSPVQSFQFENDVIILKLDKYFDKGAQVEFTIYYHGMAELAGGYKGLRYETHGSNYPIIATLSTPYLAHRWWPCKDGPGDKSDSTFIDITIKDTIIDAIPLIAVSNGILEEIEDLPAGKKKFKWRHRYPIVPYYVMVAISNYEKFTQDFEDENSSFPIDYYVFKEHESVARTGVEDLPQVMAYFSEIFGTYPFANEKYGMTQLGYYGGIENQTNTIINQMSLGWFGISIHELAHMWFADAITCENWHHGWLNEGFASYAEALAKEHLSGYDSYLDYVQYNFDFKEGGTIFIDDVSDPYNGVFRSIIYNKGAYVLHMLRGVLGDEIFFKAIKRYATDVDLIYNHATTEDFQEICELESGLDLNYFFDEWIYDEYYPDYRYNFVQNPVSNEVDIQIRQVQGAQGRRAVFKMPIRLKMEYVDGTNEEFVVMNDAEIQNFNISLSKEIADCILDDEGYILKTSTIDEGIVVATTNKQFRNLNISPNPVSTFLKIDNYSFENDVVSIFDVHGKEIRVDKRKENQSIILDFSNNKSGVYILKMKRGNEVFLKKIIKKY